MKNRRTLCAILATLALASCESGPASESPSVGVSSGGSSEQPISVSSSESPISEPTSEASSDFDEEKFPLLGITIESTGPTEFFKGDTFSAKGLVVVGHYASGKRKTLDNNRLVFSGINLNKVGVQTLTITFRGHSASYQIVVLEAGDIAIEAGGFSKAVTQRGDCASRFQSPFGLVYENQPIDTSSIRIHIAYVQDGAVVEGLLPLDDSHVRLVNFSSASLGLQEAKMTVTLGDKSATATFPYSVTNAIPFINRGQSSRFIECRVDANYQGMEGALVVGTHDDANRGYSHLFKSISSALDFFRINNLESTIAKRIYVASGDYNEKLDVTDPYLSIIGEGGEVKIHSYETISSRPGLDKEEETYVLAIRETATYFKMKGISVVNDALDLEDKPESLMAVSLLCQADAADFDACSFSGIDHAVTLNHGRRRFTDCSFLGRDGMIRGNSTSDMYLRCTFTPLPNASEKTYSFLSLDGAGKGGLQDSLELCADFDGSTFAEIDNPGKYAMMITNSPYSRINFLSCSLPTYLGNTRDTLFPSGSVSNRMKSLQFGFNGDNRPSDTDEPVAHFILDNVNGRVRFPYAWDGTSPSTYAALPEIYLNFDGFSYRNDAQQTVIAHDLNLAESSEESKVNNVLSLYPVKGIHFDEAKNMTFFAKDSYFTVNVPVGSRVDVYTEELEGSRYSVHGFAEINGDAIQDTLYIYKSLAHFYATGNVGETKTMTFKAMDDSYLKFIVITPNALTSNELENPTVGYSPTPTSIFARNYKDSVYSESYYSPATIYDQFKNNLWLEFGDEGYHRRAEGGRNTHFHTSLACYDDGRSYDELTYYGDGEYWTVYALTGGHGGTIQGDVVANYYGQTGNGIPFDTGDDVFNSVWIVYQFNAADDKGVPMSPASDRLAWVRNLWISGSAPRDYRSSNEGYHDFSAANLYDDASDHELILDDSVSSSGYTVSTGETRTCKYDISSGGLRLEGQIEYRIKPNSSLSGGQAVIRAKKGSSLSARAGEATNALQPASYSTPDYDYFEIAIPEGDNRTISLIPGETGATLFSYDLKY